MDEWNNLKLEELSALRSDGFTVEIEGESLVISGPNEEQLGWITPWANGEVELELPMSGSYHGFRLNG